MLSVTQAAEKLGVTPSRVRAMIKFGQLNAVKCGRGWIVQEEDVLDRLLRKPRAGRPSKTGSDLEQRRSRSGVSLSDARRAHRIYEDCRAMFSSLPSEDLMQHASSSEEATFYMVVSDFFLQKKQDELIEQGVF